MMVDGFQFYWHLSKLVLDERVRRNDWITSQLFAQKFPQRCENAGFSDELYPQYWDYTILWQLGKWSLICKYYMAR